MRANEDGSVSFHLGNGYIVAEYVFDAQEFFQAQRDMELGRWRWPENPDYIAVEGERGGRGRTVRIVNERTLESWWFNERVFDVDRDSAGHQAARAFFEAHPERKPWQDATTEDVWVITWGNQIMESAARLSQDGLFLIIGGGVVRLDEVRTGRRIWPEDAS